MTLEFIDHVLGVDWTRPAPLRPLDSAAFYGFPLRDNSGTRSADAVTADDDSAHPAKRRRALTTEVSVAPAPSRAPLFSSRTPWPTVVHQPLRRALSSPAQRCALAETRVRCVSAGRPCSLSLKPKHIRINPRADSESWLAPSRDDAPVFNHSSWSDELPT